MLSARHMSVGVASLAAVALFVALPGSAQAAATPIPLGNADRFVVLAGQTITNTGTTTITGDIGISPGSSLTGGPPLMILNGTSHVADPVALGAQAALGTAFDNAAGQTPATAIPSELGGSTLAPGIYSSGVFTITKTVTLDAGNDPNAIFVFQSAATLNAAAGSRVALINGASPCNVFWLVRSSATLNTTADFSGNILALTDISLFTGATVQGRAAGPQRRGHAGREHHHATDVPGVAHPHGDAHGGANGDFAKPAGHGGSLRAVSTGDGSTSGGGTNPLGLLAGVLVFAGIAGATVVAVRRRRLNV